jgi:hypothetical protein
MSTFSTEEQFFSDALRWGTSNILRERIVVETPQAGLT